MIQWVTSDEDVSHPAGCPHLIAGPLLAILNKVKEVNWEIGVRTNFGFKID